TLITSTLSAGTHQITAAYTGDSVYSISAATLTQLIAAVASTTTVTSSLNPSPVNQAVTFTTTVTATDSSIPAGTVTFTDGTTTLGTASLDAAGKATFTTSTLTAGSHTITAAYAGATGSKWTPSTGTVTQVVNKAT